ncbi:MAG: hypothetical protein ACUVT5_07570 [Candidatus Bathyarchaeales archaeon]
MPTPEELIEQGCFLEAAKLYHEKALKAKNIHERRRFLNFAGRCYESAGESSLATKCFLEAGDLELALASAIKAKNPLVLSTALAESGRKNDIVDLLLKCALRLVEAREFGAARSFCKEALKFRHSDLATAMIYLIDGFMEGKSEKVVLSVKQARASNEDTTLAREISFIANKFLANMPKVPSQAKEIPKRCPECGAPFPLQKRRSKVIECEYCGFMLRID